MRITVRVHPGAREDTVGGRYGDVEPPILTLRVRARAVDGRANDAVVELVAEKAGVLRRDVVIRSGHRSRTKVLDVAGLDEKSFVALFESRGTDCTRSDAPTAPVTTPAETAPAQTAPAQTAPAQTAPEPTAQTARVV